MKKRNPYFDVLKFVAMMLVVYGHVAGVFHCEFGQPLISNFIVGMNMPIFFLISGFFLAKTVEKGDWKMLVEHVLGYFWPHALASSVFAGLSVACSLRGCENGIIGYAGRNFLFGGWFLYCLSLSLTMTFCCWRLKNMTIRVLVFCAIFLILPCVDGVWYIHELRSMLPFFLIGVLVLTKRRIWNDAWIGATCLSLYVVGVFVQGSIHQNGLSFYNMPTTWSAFAGDSTSFILYVLRIVNGVIGSVGVMWIIQWLFERAKFLEKVAPLGMTTLWVYILHRWFLDRVRDLGWCTDKVWCSIAWTLALFAFCHVLGLCGQRIPEFAKGVWMRGSSR